MRHLSVLAALLTFSGCLRTELPPRPDAGDAGTIGDAGPNPRARARARDRAGSKRARVAHGRVAATPGGRARVVGSAPARRGAAPRMDPARRAGRAPRRGPRRAPAPRLESRTHRRVHAHRGRSEAPPARRGAPPAGRRADPRRRRVVGERGRDHARRPDRPPLACRRHPGGRRRRRRIVAPGRRRQRITDAPKPRRALRRPGRPVGFRRARALRGGSPGGGQRDPDRVPERGVAGMGGAPCWSPPDRCGRPASIASSSRRRCSTRPGRRSAPSRRASSPERQTSGRRPVPVRR